MTVSDTKGWTHIFSRDHDDHDDKTDNDTHQCRGVCSIFCTNSRSRPNEVPNTSRGSNTNSERYRVQNYITPKLVRLLKQGE